MKRMVKLILILCTTGFPLILTYQNYQKHRAFLDLAGGTSDLEISSLNIHNQQRLVEIYDQDVITIFEDLLGKSSKLLGSSGTSYYLRFRFRNGMNVKTHIFLGEWNKEKVMIDVVVPGGFISVSEPDLEPRSLGDFDNDNFLSVLEFLSFPIRDVAGLVLVLHADGSAEYRFDEKLLHGPIGRKAGEIMDKQKGA